MFFVLKLNYQIKSLNEISQVIESWLKIKDVHIIYMLSLLKREDQIYYWPLKLALSGKYVCGHDKYINFGHIKV